MMLRRVKQSVMTAELCGESRLCHMNWSSALTAGLLFTSGLLFCSAMATFLWPRCQTKEPMCSSRCPVHQYGSRLAAIKNKKLTQSQWVQVNTDSTEKLSSRETEQWQLWRTYSNYDPAAFVTKCDALLQFPARVQCLWMCVFICFDLLWRTKSVWSAEIHLSSYQQQKKPLLLLRNPCKK